MLESSASPAFVVEPGDKATSVSAYISQGVIVGDLVTREIVRASTWLRTPGLPEYATLFRVTVTRAAGTGEPLVLRSPEIHVPIAQLIAIHLTPPGEDPVEYDPNELNRKLEPVSAISGPFRFDGLLRMPGHMTLAKQMGLMREPFVMLYTVSVTSALEPTRVVRVPMALLRPAAFCFVPRAAK